jgi:uncharacterized membrane protein YfcA
MDPHMDPVRVTAISLAIVCANAGSGSVAYFRMKRVDVKSAFSFGLATLPGAVLGALWTQKIPRHAFNLIFGVLLVLASAFLLWKPEPPVEDEGEPDPSHTKREITDAEGHEHIYHFPMALGLVLSAIVGCLSSLLGIGGGIIHVPVLNRNLNFPVHIATATSHVILAVMALVGTITHVWEGSLDGAWVTVAWLALGAIVGAQIGARLSKRLKGSGIIRSLAVALGIVGLRILMIALG